MEHRSNLHTVCRHGLALDLLPGIPVNIFKLNGIRNLLAVLIERPSRIILKGELPVSVIVRRYRFGVKLLRPVVQIHGRACRTISFLIVIVIPDNITHDGHSRRRILMQILPEVSDILPLITVCKGGRIACYLDFCRILDDVSLQSVSGNVLKYSHIGVTGTCLHLHVRFSVRKQLYVYKFRTGTVAVIVIFKRIFHGDGTRPEMVDNRKSVGGISFDFLLILSSNPARIQGILRGNTRGGRPFIRFHCHVFWHFYGCLPLILCIRPDRNSIIFIFGIFRYFRRIRKIQIGRINHNIDLVGPHSCGVILVIPGHSHREADCLNFMGQRDTHGFQVPVGIRLSDHLGLLICIADRIHFHIQV